MKIVPSYTVSLLVAASVVLGGLFSVSAEAAGPNLISNPSLETASGSAPQDWSKKSYGLGSFILSFTYPVAGVSGGQAAKTDLKFNLGVPVGWMPKSVPVIAGHTYAFSNSSLGTVKSSVDVVYNYSGGFSTTVHLGDVPVQASFTPFSTSFKVPTGVTSLTVFHSIKDKGSLTVDDYSLVDSGAVADTIPPTVSVTSPTANQSLANTVNLAASASDAGGVAGVKFFVDGAQVGSEDTSSPYTASFNTATVTNAAHSVFAVARDASGNNATSSAVSFVVNNPVPKATLTVNVVVTNNDGGTKVVADFPLLLNGMPITSGVATTTAPGTYTVTEATSSLYTLTISGSCNAAGSVTLANGDNKSCTFTNNDLDKQAPTVSLTSPTSGQVASSTISLSGTASDGTGVAGVTFYVDNAKVGAEDTSSPYSVNLDTKTLTNAGHSAFVVARDAAGNVATSTTVSFTVNNPPAPTTGKLTVTISMVNNNGGVATAANFALFLNGMAIQNGVATTTAPGTFTLTQNGPTGYTTVIAGACAANGSVTIAAGDNKACTVTNDDIAVTPPPSNNLIANPSFELGATSSPTSWFTGDWGTNTHTYTYPVSPAADGLRAARVDITAYTDGDAKWYFNRVTGVGGKFYQFSDYYRSNIPSWVTVEYQMADGTFTYQDIGLNLPAASTWTKFTAQINAPANATGLTILHLIKQVGFLETDNYSLTETAADKFAQGLVSFAFDDSLQDQYDNAFPILNAAGLKGSFYIITGPTGLDTDGQMTTAEVLDIQAKGHEVAAHTRSHPDLTTLTLAQITSEISGSRQDLLNMGIANVDTFTYPYGTYNNQVVQAVKDAGFKGARSVNEGFNVPSSDKFVLYDQHLENNTTVASMKAAIDQAIANKQWLIIEAHQQAPSSCGSEQYCNTNATLQAIVDYVKQTGIKNVTLREGVQLMNP